MVVRGELAGSSTSLPSTGSTRTPHGACRAGPEHRNRTSQLREFFLESGDLAVVGALLSLVALTGAAVVGARKGGRTFRLLAAAAIGTTLAGLLTLGLTAISFAHLQMPALPVAFIGVVAIAARQPRSHHVSGRGWRRGSSRSRSGHRRNRRWMPDVRRSLQERESSVGADLLETGPAALSRER